MTTTTKKQDEPTVGELIEKLPKDAKGEIVIAEYNRTETALAELENRLQGVVFDVATTDGMKEAKDARRSLTKLRTTLDKRRLEMKRPLLDLGKALDGRAKTITARISKLEDPLDGQIKAEEQRAERIRLEHERVERERLDGIRRRVEWLRATPDQHIHASPAAIEAAMDELMADPLEGFEELEREAALVRDEAVAKLHDHLTLAKQREAEQAELAELRRFKAEKEAAEEEARAKAEASAPSVDAGAGIEPLDEPSHVGVDMGAGDDRTVTAPARSPVLSSFLSKHGSKAEPAPALAGKSVRMFYPKELVAQLNGDPDDRELLGAFFSEEETFDLFREEDEDGNQTRYVAELVLRRVAVKEGA